MPRRRELTIEEQVATQLAEMPDTVLACRDSSLRHKWEISTNFTATTVTQVGRGVQFFRREMECQRGCGVIATELYRYAKGILTRETRNLNYTDAPGYLLHDVGRQTGLAGLIHYEQFRRQLRAAEAAGNVTRIGKKTG